MTIDDLAVFIQNEFQIMRGEMATKDEVAIGFSGIRADIFSIQEAISSLTTRVSHLENRMASLEGKFEILEERMENGFHNLVLELQDIRRMIKKIDRREQVKKLTIRMDVVEQKLGAA